MFAMRKWRIWLLSTYHENILSKGLYIFRYILVSILKVFFLCFYSKHFFARNICASVCLTDKVSTCGGCYHKWWEVPLHLTFRQINHSKLASRMVIGMSFFAMMGYNYPDIGLFQDFTSAFDSVNKFRNTHLKIKK